jgi:hypothetical protein
MQESAEDRTNRLKRVAQLTERLHSLEDLLASEGDERQREVYEKDKTEIMEMLRQIRRT